MMQNRTMVIRTISAVRFDIRRPILFRRNKDKETSKRSSQTFYRSWKIKEILLQKPVTEELKGWLTIPYKQTRKKSEKYAGTIYVRSP